MPLHRMRDLVATQPAKGVALLALATLLTGCPPPPTLPDCFTGKAAPTPAQEEKWAAAAKATRLELAIDGSGSMLGLTGSQQGVSAWKSLLLGVTTAASQNGLEVSTSRVGGGKSEKFDGILKSTQPCFFKGCNGFPNVSSSLESVWNTPGLKPKQPPLRIAISDLEVNNGDITNLVASIEPHVKEGAVIGVLAIQLPFNGKVYNSDGEVIYNGKTKRPVYLLATGKQDQLHSLLSDIRTNAAVKGIPTEAIQITLLDRQANEPTLVAKSVMGEGIGSQAGIQLKGVNYNQYNNPSYQIVWLWPKANGLTINSGSSVASNEQSPDLGLIRLESIVPKATTVGNGVSIKEFSISGRDLSVAIQIPKKAPAQAIRAVVPRGQLPEAWWMGWNRSSNDKEQPQGKTDGLLLLLTSLSKLMVEEGTTPAASLCTAYSHKQGA